MFLQTLSLSVCISHSVCACICGVCVCHAFPVYISIAMWQTLSLIKVFFFKIQSNGLYWNIWDIGLVMTSLNDVIFVFLPVKLAPTMGAKQQWYSYWSFLLHLFQNFMYFTYLALFHASLSVFLTDKSTDVLNTSHINNDH